MWTALMVLGAALLLLVAVLAAVLALANPLPDDPIRCPVVGMVIHDPATAPRAEYRGRTYYFRCDWCRERFEEDPERFVRSGEGARAT